ncbi:MAG: Gfo/Idh/MocA family oxidoreductase [Isosphaeraceae bacterium]|nr:Gfo/Idh/MocA family oxidoreductase [Isosphaeraceae bacterium]
MGSPGVSTIAGRPSVGLIGGGFIGPVHAEALRRLGVPVAGLLGSSPDRAEAAAARLGAARVYRDLEELLADPHVGIVHITSPNDAHHSQALAALAAGKHVVCEKPLATTSAATRELVAAAASRPSLVAAVCYNIRFYPLCREMRERVAAGDIGRPVAVTGSYTQDWLSRPTDYNWRVEADGATDLRAAADIGTHWMDLAQYVTGAKIESVAADLSTVHPVRRRPRGAVETFSGSASSGGDLVDVSVTTEDQAFVLLRLAGGMRGAFHVSQVMPGRKNRLLLEVTGEEGTLVWDSEEPNRLEIGRRDRANESLIRDPALLHPAAAAAAAYPGGHAEGFPDTFVALFRAVHARITRPNEPIDALPTFVDGHREALLCEAIARSARSEAWAVVEDDPRPVGTTGGH